MSQKRLNLNKQSVNVSDIQLNVTCPECGRSYGVQCKRPNFSKNVSCLHGTFYVSIIPMRGVVDITVDFQRGSDNQILGVEFTAEIES